MREHRPIDRDAPLLAAKVLAFFDAGFRSGLRLFLVLPFLLVLLHLG